ncbi:ABC transporter ATP-binding protein [Pimelobacter simplex]|nr:ABC transporter ATP-binding protein [Pimelobacter simplex]
MIEIADVAVRYGHGATAVEGLRMRAAPARVTAIVGGNGAGKTTVLRLLSGVLGAHDGRCVAGEVTVDGHALLGRSPAAIVRRGITHVPEGRHVFGSLTVEENLRAGATTQRSSLPALLAEAYARFPILAERRRQRAGLLSGGQQQMLAIARGLMSRPRYVLLDEPTLGLAPLMVDQIRDIVADLRASGIGVVIVEQNAAMALSVADEGYVLEQGRTTLSGAAAVLRDDPMVAALYLGGSAEDRPTFAVGRCDIGTWAS